MTGTLEDEIIEGDQDEFQPPEYIADLTEHDDNYGNVQANVDRVGAVTGSGDPSFGTVSEFNAEAAPEAVPEPVLHEGDSFEDPHNHD